MGRKIFDSLSWRHESLVGPKEMETKRTAEIEKLRRLAEQHLCEQCYKIYEYILEPNIMAIPPPLSDWKQAESWVTLMVMKHKGVFRGDEMFFTVDEEADEEILQKVDVKAFQKIRKDKFWRKLQYLRKHGILGDCSYTFLSKASEIRNMIHEVYYEFSEQDRNVFRWANAITSQIYSTMMFDLREDLAVKLRLQAEKASERLLSQLFG